jgi:hypothetical protein
MRRWTIVIDLAFLGLFVALGRSAHDHGISARGMLSTCWPFVVGLGCGWLVVLARRSDPRTLTSGAIIVALTVVVGMVLRIIAGQGTAVAFVVVALCFLGLFFEGWRAVLLGLRRLAARSSSS